MSVELADHNHSLMRRITTDGVAWSVCLPLGEGAILEVGQGEWIFGAMMQPFVKLL